MREQKSLTSSTDEYQRISTNKQPRTLYYWLARVGSKTSWTITILVILNLICYASTIDGYFLADDFIHISYLYKVFNGHPQLLLENFWSNWMQTEGTQFYRPVISLTLAFDYLLWGADAKGYHLSNLVFQILSSVGVFLVAKRLFLTDLKGLKKTSSEEESDEVAQPKSRIRLSPDHVYTINFASFFAACIFSVHPLHPEVVSWVIGRVDSVCTAAYLFALWLFLLSLQSNRTKTIVRAKIASIILFIIALGSKEMAVTLPPTLVLLLFCFQTPVYGQTRSIPARVLNAFRASLPYWIVLVIYLIVRTCALGEFMGGYQGSIGEGFSSSIFERLVSQKAAYRIIFPLNMEIFTPDAKVITYLRIVYSVITGCFVLSLLISRSKNIVIKSIIFTGTWFLLIMIPTIPVWNLTETLQSSRFIYMGTVPISILLAIIICPIARFGRRTIKRREKTNFTLRITQDALKGISSITAISMVLIFASVTYKNNSAWAHAGAEVKKLRKQVVRTINEFAGNRKIALLNIPNKYKGAHMIYNGAMMQVLLAPPLTSENLQSRLISFEPAMFGDTNLVRASRLRSLIVNSPEVPFYEWKSDEFKLRRIKLPEDGDPNIFLKGLNNSIEKDSCLLSPEINLPALRVDFVVIELSLVKNKKLKAKNIPKSLPLFLYWLSGDGKHLSNENMLTQTIDSSKSLQTIKFPTSQFKNWIKAPVIERVALASPQNFFKIKVNSIQCYRAIESIPTIALANSNLKMDERGIINLGPEIKSIDITYDASKTKEGSGVRIEVSKPNSWFEHYSGTLRDDSFSEHVHFAKEFPATYSTGQKFDLSMITRSGFYQLRICAVNQQGKIAGYFSDPIVFQISRK